MGCINDNEWVYQMKSNQNKIGLYIKIMIAACSLYAISAGLRSIYGIMLGTISEETGIAYATVSFAIAVGQLVFGIAQPVFGAIALKKSNSFALTVGCILIALGLAMIPFCTTGWMLMLFLGILLPTGTGAISFGIIMGAITPKLGATRAATASGFINASSGVGSIVFSPLIQSLFSSVGLKTTMLVFSALIIVLIPISLWVGRTHKTECAVSSKKTNNGNVLTMLKQAVSSRSYLFLILGFFTCGFHMAIIETHLYLQFMSYSIAGSLAALAFSVYGFSSVIGSLISGFLSGRFRMKYMLGSLYGSRVFIALVFLLLPKTAYVMFGFVALLGLTGAATVIPTSGLVSKLFGAENLGVLFGFIFFCHQIGSFFSAWLGGKFVAATGSYILIWSVSAILSLCAMIASFCISEQKQLVNAYSSAHVLKGDKYGEHD